MPFQTVAGRQAFYVQRERILPGQPPLLFVHGAGGTHQHWLLQVREPSLAPSLALDLPGHGRSEGPGKTSIEAYAAWLLAFLDTLEVEQAVLAGHSMGGAIALSTSLSNPERVAGLGLVATGARLRVNPALLDAIPRDQQVAIQAICGAALGPDAAPALHQLCVEQMAAVDATVIYDDFCACDRFDVMEVLGQIAAPTLVISGSHDALTPQKYSLYLRDHIPEARLHLVSGAGHMVMLENPDEVNRALAGFLAHL